MFTPSGLLLDLARVWWTMAGVHGVVDAMAVSKLNVLHLHLTDSEAFPVESTAFNATSLAFDPANGCTSSDTSFWSTYHVVLSLAPPLTRRTPHSTW